MDLGHRYKRHVVFSYALALLNYLSNYKERNAKYQMDGGFDIGADGYGDCDLFCVCDCGEIDMLFSLIYLQIIV